MAVKPPPLLRSGEPQIDSRQSGIYADRRPLHIWSVDIGGHVARVNVTELRQNLPAYLIEVRKGREIEVTSRGKVIARIVAGSETHDDAHARLLAARKRCRIGDVLSPTGAAWNAERARS